MKPLQLLSASLLSTGLLLLAACGKSETPAPSAANAAAANDIRVVRISADDTMKFNLTEIRVKAGETFQVVMTNAGRMPKEVMAHNWVLLRPMSDADVNALALSAASKAPAYLPDDLSAVLAHTKLLGAGQSDRIEVTAPATSGVYPFVCTFPGHFAMMKGKLIVE